MATIKLFALTSTGNRRFLTNQPAVNNDVDLHLIARNKLMACAATEEAMSQRRVRDDVPDTTAVEAQLWSKATMLDSDWAYR